MNRSVNNIISAQPTQDGDGVRISRVIGSRQLREYDPFLLLDELKSDSAVDYIGGFPDHPHRGFETITYMLNGKMRHKDSAGHEGVVGPGDLQWMTAGSGIVHSEMPEQTHGQLWGFQLWLNLPAKEKMCAPRYQEVSSEQIPQWPLDHGRVKVLAGQLAVSGEQLIVGAAKEVATQPILLDVQINGGQWLCPLPEHQAAWVYVYQGSVKIGGDVVGEQQLALLSSGDALSIAADAEAGMLVASAEPIGEPIARAGPFVMNTQAELQQAFLDFSQR